VACTSTGNITAQKTIATLKMRTSHLSGLIIFEDQKKAKIMGG
jgi:hypothetical protein